MASDLPRTQDSTSDVHPAETAVPGPPFQDMFDEVLAYLLENAKCEGGNFAEDFGDACFYGQAFLVWHGVETADADMTTRGLHAAAFALGQAEKFLDNPAGFLEAGDDLVMGLLGLLETLQRYDQAVALLGADAVKEALPADKAQIADEVKGSVQGLDVLLQVMGDYVPDADTYSVYTYGNTVVTALFALLDVELARRYPTLSAAWLERAATIAETIHSQAWDDSLGGYRFSPENEKLYLYPNIIMMLLYGRMYSLGSDPTHLERALVLYEAIQPLKNVEQGSYRSPYSAVTMGAKTDDYKTLSSQLYTILAFLTLYEQTDDALYLDEVDVLLSFIDSHLRQGGKILHHWMDGEIAKPEHLEYYCTGCNFQALYALKYLWGEL
jgi:hypothetical protein